MTINEGKTTVASALGRQFLGFRFWVAPGGLVRRGTAVQGLLIFKQRIRWQTRRTRGRSVEPIVERLRHRFRTVQLKDWRRGKTLYRALWALGARPDQAQRAAANSRCWWRNSRCELSRLMPIAYFERLGVPRLS